MVHSVMEIRGGRTHTCKGPSWLAVSGVTHLGVFADVAGSMEDGFRLNTSSPQDGCCGTVAPPPQALYVTADRLV